MSQQIDKYMVDCIIFCNAPLDCENHAEMDLSRLLLSVRLKQIELRKNLAVHLPDINIGSSSI